MNYPCWFTPINKNLAKCLIEYGYYFLEKCELDEYEDNRLKVCGWYIISSCGCIIVWHEGVSYLIPTEDKDIHPKSAKLPTQKAVIKDTKEIIEKVIVAEKNKYLQLTLKL